MAADSCAGADSLAAGASVLGAVSPVAVDFWMERGAWTGACRAACFEAWRVAVCVCDEDLLAPFVCPVLAEVLAVLPGKALAATSVSTPVRATLPAISQRLTRPSLRRAASRMFV